MRQIMIFTVITAHFVTTANAEMSKSDRDELFDRVEQMCSNADAEVTRYVKFEGEAGAQGIVKLVGAEISGAATVEQYENLEQQLNDFRTNPTICQFEAFELLAPIFGGALSDEQGALPVEEQFICDFPEDRRHVLFPGEGDTPDVPAGFTRVETSGNDQVLDLEDLVQRGQYGFAISITANEFRHAVKKFGKYSKQAYYQADRFSFVLRSLGDSDGQDVQYVQGFSAENELEMLLKEYGSEIGKFNCISSQEPA